MDRCVIAITIIHPCKIRTFAKREWRRDFKSLINRGMQAQHHYLLFFYEEDKLSVRYIKGIFALFYKPRKIMNRTRHSRKCTLGAITKLNAWKGPICYWYGPAICSITLQFYCKSRSPPLCAASILHRSFHLGQLWNSALSYAVYFSMIKGRIYIEGHDKVWFGNTLRSYSKGCDAGGSSWKRRLEWTNLSHIYKSRQKVPNKTQFHIRCQQMRALLLQFFYPHEDD